MMAWVQYGRMNRALCCFQEPHVTWCVAGELTAIVETRELVNGLGQMCGRLFQSIAYSGYSNAY